MIFSSKGHSFTNTVYSKQNDNFFNGSIGITPCGEGKFQGMYVSKLGTK